MNYNLTIITRTGNLSDMCSITCLAANVKHELPEFLKFFHHEVWQPADRNFIGRSAIEAEKVISRPDNHADERIG